MGGITIQKKNKLLVTNTSTLVNFCCLTGSWSKSRTHYFIRLTTNINNIDVTQNCQ